MTAETFQASYLQESLYRAAKGEESAVNVGLALDARCTLDVPRLLAAISALAARHEALRTTLASIDGEVCQVIAPQVKPAVVVVDLSGEENPEEEAQRLARDYMRRPFALQGPVLFRVMVLACGPNRHLVVFSLHHAIMDGWSAGVLLADLRAAYHAAGQSPAWEAQEAPGVREAPGVQGVPGVQEAPGVAVAEVPAGPEVPAAPDGPEVADGPDGSLADEADGAAPPLQPADYAAWERQPADSAALDGWRTRLRGHSPRVRVPGTEDPGPGQLSLPCELPAGEQAVAEGVERLARQLRVPVTAVLAAAVAASLGEYVGDSQGLIIGLVRANREREELRDVVGYLADIAPLPIDLGGDPDFATLVSRAAGAIAYSRENPVPLGALAGLLRRRGDGPLFDVCLNYLPVAAVADAVGGGGADGGDGGDMEEAHGELRFLPIEVGDTEPAASRWWAGTALIDYVVRSAGAGQLSGRVRGDLNTLPAGLVTELAEGFWAALLRGTGDPGMAASDLAAGVRGAAR
jgi:Condensation domain